MSAQPAAWPGDPDQRSDHLSWLNFEEEVPQGLRAAQRERQQAVCGESVIGTRCSVARSAAAFPDRLRLRERNIAPRTARPGTESSERLGRHWWKIERSISWLFGHRRPIVRYERNGSHFLASDGLVDSPCAALNSTPSIPASGLRPLLSGNRVPEYVPSNGTPVELWTCTGGTNQQWKRG